MCFLGWFSKYYLIEGFTIKFKRSSTNRSCTTSWCGTQFFSFSQTLGVCMDMGLYVPMVNKDPLINKDTLVSGNASDKKNLHLN